MAFIYLEQSNHRENGYRVVEQIPHERAQPEHKRIASIHELQMFGSRLSFLDQNNCKTGDEKREAECEARRNIEAAQVFIFNLVRNVCEIARQRVIDHAYTTCRGLGKIFEQSIGEQVDHQRRHMIRLIIKVAHNGESLVHVFEIERRSLAQKVLKKTRLFRRGRLLERHRRLQSKIGRHKVLVIQLAKAQLRHLDQIVFDWVARRQTQGHFIFVIQIEGLRVALILQLILKQVAELIQKCGARCVVGRIVFAILSKVYAQHWRVLVYDGPVFEVNQIYHENEYGQKDLRYNERFVS